MPFTLQINASVRNKTCDLKAKGCIKHPLALFNLKLTVFSSDSD
jgi:hypothetical protein